MATELEILVAQAVALAGGDHPCSLLGHRWASSGGANCGCSDHGSCSVPVNRCIACGDYDYGDNEEARRIRTHCAEEAEKEQRDG